jgi:hypothetical protein
MKVGGLYQTERRVSFEIGGGGEDAVSFKNGS